MPDQSVIPMFDNSRNRPIYATSTSLYGENVDIVEEWDSVTPPPYNVVGTVIRAANAVHEVEEKVIFTMEESDIIYNSGSNGKDKPYMHGINEEPEKSDSGSSSKYEEISSNSVEMTLNYKTSAEINMTKRNSSECYFSNTNSTVILESTISTSSTVNDTFKKIQDKLGQGEFVSNLRIIDIMEIFNTLAMFLAPTLSTEVTSTTDYSLSSDNSTFRSSEDESFDEVDAESVTHFTEKTLDRTFSQIHQNEGEAELSDIKERDEHIDNEHPGDIINSDDYAIVTDECDHEKIEKNSKLNPQVIPRSEFAKNGIDEEEKRIKSDCNVGHIGTSKENSGQQKSSNCKSADVTKLWELRNEIHGKYDEEDEKDKKSPVLVHFERTLWEKLVAGLKCSQRDCREALRPTESVRRYLIEPSISRARKHSTRQL